MGEFKLLEELHNRDIDFQNFCDEIGLLPEVVIEAVKECDFGKQYDYFEAFVVKGADKALFEDTLNFFSQFTSKEQVIPYLEYAIMKSKDRRYRKMFNSVHRMVNLSEIIGKEMDSYDALKIQYLIMGIEALYTIENIDLRKYKMVEAFFTNHISGVSQGIILEKVKRAYINHFEDNEQFIGESDQEYTNRIELLKSELLTIEVFSRIISEVRNKLVHEAEYWTFSFSNDEFPLIIPLVVAETKSEYRESLRTRLNPIEKVYSVSLSYTEFKNICIEGYLNFIMSSMEKVFTQENSN